MFFLLPLLIGVILVVVIRFFEEGIVWAVIIVLQVVAFLGLISSEVVLPFEGFLPFQSQLVFEALFEAGVVLFLLALAAILIGRIIAFEEPARLSPALVVALVFGKQEEVFSSREWLVA